MVQKTTKEVALARKRVIVPAVLVAALALGLPSFAGQLTGTIRGKVVDKQGFRLPGAYVYVTSPALLGVRNFITSETGLYGFVDLPPGIYKVTVEMPGFKTVNVERVTLVAGGTATADVKLESSEIEEEITSREAVSALDKESIRHAVFLDKDLLTRLPLPRDFTSILGLIPGTVFVGDTPGYALSVSGAPVTGNTFAMDGMNVTDPLSGGTILRMDVDAIDEVVVEETGASLEHTPAQGAYINVINKSGGNSSEGRLLFAYTGSGLTQQLWSAQQLNEMRLAAPTIDRQNTDISMAVGGPALRDYGWYFMDVRYKYRSQATPFVKSVDPLGITNYPYLFQDKDLSALLKLTARVPQKYQATLEATLSGVNEPVYANDVAFNRPVSTTHDLDGQSLFMGKASLGYQINPITSVAIWASYATFRQPLLLNGGADVMAFYTDLGTNSTFGGGFSNDREARRRLTASATIMRLQDKAFGVSHEIVGGVEYNSLAADSSVWKVNDMVLDYLNGSPYLYGLAVSPLTGHTVGKGLVGFSILPGSDGGMDVRRQDHGIGGFVQDTMNFGRRVALSLGVRFDHWTAGFLSLTKGAVSNTIPASIADSEITPIYGFNPFLSIGIGAWDKAVTWNSLYPRAGLSIDVLGGGKTILKASYAMVPESLGLGYSKTLDPFPIDRVHDFIWYDENGDGQVSATDTFTAVPFNYNVYRSSYYEARVQPGLTAPTTNEWTAGVEQELARDFTFSLTCMFRSEHDVIADVMFDPATSQPWYNPAQSPEGWWVPFTTIVPAAGSYESTPVTAYFRSTTAPQPFDRIQNVPELSRRYRGLELAFRKRMSHNWQLFASAVWSSTTGTTGLLSPWSMGTSASPLTPNSFVNVPMSSRADQDRPLVFRLMGTVRFKWDIYLSWYLRAMSGAPWARSVTIIPPESWVTENQADGTPVSVLLEPLGSRRYPYYKNADLRLQKDFVKKGLTRLSVYVDVLNVLGDKYRILDQNDAGVWAPDAPGSSTGTRTVSSTFGQFISASGARTFAFSLSLGF